MICKIIFIKPFDVVFLKDQSNIYSESVHLFVLGLLAQNVVQVVVDH